MHVSKGKVQKFADFIKGLSRTIIERSGNAEKMLSFAKLGWIFGYSVPSLKISDWGNEVIVDE